MDSNHSSRAETPGIYIAEPEVNGIEYRSGRLSSMTESRTPSRSGAASASSEFNESTSTREQTHPNHLSQQEILASFQEEYLRMMRALIDSQLEENRLQREATRMKEDILAYALRLQVAVIMAEEDEKMIHQLKKETKESKKNLALAKKQAADAAETIKLLRQEASNLKKSVKDLLSEKARPSSSSGKIGLITPSNSSANLFESVGQVFRAADREVDQLIMMHKPLQQLPHTGGDIAAFTPFQQWKVKSFRYATDTPAGSENHDYDVVNVVSNYLKESRATAKEPGSLAPSDSSTSIESLPVVTPKLRFSLASQGNLSDAEFQSLASRSSDLPFQRARDNPLRRLTLSRVGKLSAQILASRGKTNDASGFDSGSISESFPMPRQSLSPLSHSR